MPVYLLTVHAYRSWSEANPRGYVQHDAGLQAPNERRAKWRAAHAKWPPARFDAAAQQIAHSLLLTIANEQGVRVHAGATTHTHMHSLVSFQSPTCSCGASEHCRRECRARRFAELFLTRFKRKFGQQLAIAYTSRGSGRKYLSHGWDITRVRNREHFDHLIDVYLPRHEASDGGTFRRYA